MATRDERGIPCSHLPTQPQREAETTDRRTVMADKDTTTTEGPTGPTDPPNEIVTKLTAYVGEEKAKEVAAKAKDAGAETLADAALLTEADWVGFGVPLVKARKLVAELTKSTTAPAPVPDASASAFNAIAMLPQVPSDEAFLKLLQVGGTLKMEPTDVMSAVRVLFAQRFDLFGIEDKVLEAMETRAEQMEEPYPQVYYDVQKALSRKAHAEVLSALEVSSARVFTERNKKAFLGRLSGIWDHLASFNERATAYQQTWMTKMANPGLMMAMLRGAGSIAGLDAAPDATPMLDAASGVIDNINKMFAGPGIPVARALAADAVQLRQLLERTDLIAATGATTRDEMLKKLGIAVTADASRTEHTITQYVLSVLNVPDVPTNQLPQYIAAVAELGANIPWDTLRTSRAVNGGTSPRRTSDNRTGGGTY